MEKRILVIDDEIGVREAFVEALVPVGYRVVTAANGEEGVVKAVEAKPALIFLDLKMPGMDGIETLRRLQDSSAGVPVYIVTAFRAEYMHRLKVAAEKGLQFNVLDKPLDGDQIRASVRGILEGPEVFETE